jgi:hypothetical protein
LIKIFSPGPVLFKQVRAGQHAREFTMCKFRTMKLLTDDSIHRDYAINFITGQRLEFSDARKRREQVFKMTRDPRITPIGALLRRTSLDELPQLLNVFRGEMSIVGPRPPIFYELNHYKEWHRKRLRAKPGLTGRSGVRRWCCRPVHRLVAEERHRDLFERSPWCSRRGLLGPVSRERARASISVVGCGTSLNFIRNFSQMPGVRMKVAVDLNKGRLPHQPAVPVGPDLTSIDEVLATRRSTRSRRRCPRTRLMAALSTEALVESRCGERGGGRDLVRTAEP